MLRESYKTLVYNDYILMITTTFKIRTYMRQRYFTVPECFQPIDTEATNFQGIRLSTKAEQHDFLENRYKQGLAMFDSAGEPIIASPVTYVPLNGQTWHIVKMKAKVPFATSRLNFKGYGLIRNVVTNEELYLKTDVLAKMPISYTNDISEVEARCKANVIINALKK